MNTLLTWGHPATDTLLSTTTHHWLETDATEQVFNQTPLLKKLKSKARMINGGASGLVPLMIEENSTATWYSGYDTIDITPQEGFTNSQPVWKNLADSISISGDEFRRNNGKDKVIDILRGKTVQAKLSLNAQLTTALFAAAQGSKAIMPLALMVDATSSIQDINSTTYSFWQADVNASGSFAGQGLDDMRTLYTDIGMRSPATNVDTIVSTSTVYNYYEKSLQPQARYSSMSSADASFESLRFKASDVFYDSQCTSGVMYMFPSQHLYFVINTNADMTPTEYVKPANQDARVAQVVIMLMFVTNARRKLGKLTGISA